MARHTLFAYVDGSDLHADAERLESAFARFVGETNWLSSSPWIVNQQHVADSRSQADDLPDWDLGLNFDLPDPRTGAPGWFSDVETIAGFLGRLHAETGRSFSIGIGDDETGMVEDLFRVDRAAPDLVKLRAIIGAVDDRA